MFVRLTQPTVITIALVAMGASTTNAEVRTWTDNTGRFSVEAELVVIRADRIVLEKADGATANVAIARLSEADREFLKTAAKLDAKMSGYDGPLAFPDALTEPPARNDAKAPFDLAEFLRAPLPEDNAAPLCLEAFAEIDSLMMDFILGPYDELSAADQVEYKRLHTMFRERWNKYDQFEQARESDPRSVDTAEIDAWLAEYDAGFQELAVAQSRPECVFQTGYSIDTLLPHIQIARHVARIVVWRTRRDIQRGDLERPLQDLKMLLRLTRDLQVRGTLVAQLVSIAIEGQCCEAVRMVLNSPDIDVAHCDRLLALLTEHDAKRIDAFLEGTRAEYIICRQALHDLQHRTGTFDPEFMRDEMDIRGNTTSPLACFKLILSLFGGGSQETEGRLARLQGALQPSAWSGGKLLSDEDYAKDVEALNRHFSTMLSHARQPDFRRTGYADIEAAWEPMDETILAGLFIPAEGAFLSRILRSEARFGGQNA